MKQRNFILMFLVCGILKIAAQNEVAIYVVGDASDPYKKVVASNLTQAVNADGYFRAVERTLDFLGVLDREINYQNSGAVSQSKIIELGQQFGAQYVFVVDLNNIFGELYASSRIINVARNIVEAASDESYKVSNIDDLRTFAKRISTSTLSKLPDNVVKQKQAKIDADLKLVNHYAYYKLFDVSNFYFNCRKYTNLSRVAVLKFLHACKNLGLENNIGYPIYFAKEIVNRGKPFKDGNVKYQPIQIKLYRISQTGEFGYDIWNVSVNDVLRMVKGGDFGMRGSYLYER